MLFALGILVAWPQASCIPCHACAATFPGHTILAVYRNPLMQHQRDRHRMWRQQMTFP